MKTREMIVPRDLIKKFYPHPEPYGDGDYVVDLVNGMYTDVFYREEGYFVTITNDKELIQYLNKNKLKPREYFFRNGVFALRIVEQRDVELILDWRYINPITLKLEIPSDHNLPDEFMFCFYWIEVGRAAIEDNMMTLEVYEKDLIHMIDIGLAIDLILESFKKE